MNGRDLARLELLYHGGYMTCADAARFICRHGIRLEMWGGGGTWLTVRVRRAKLRYQGGFGNWYTPWQDSPGLWRIAGG